MTADKDLLLRRAASGCYKVRLLTSATPLHILDDSARFSRFLL